MVALRVWEVGGEGASGWSDPVSARRWQYDICYRRVFLAG